LPKKETVIPATKLPPPYGLLSEEWSRRVNYYFEARSYNNRFVQCRDSGDGYMCDVSVSSTYSIYELSGKCYDTKNVERLTSRATDRKVDVLCIMSPGAFHDKWGY
jgi:hypothetical protein